MSLKAEAPVFSHAEIAKMVLGSKSEIERRIEELETALRGVGGLETQLLDMTKELFESMWREPKGNPELQASTDELHKKIKGIEDELNCLREALAKMNDDSSGF
jgi:hypothetical protein